MELTRWQRWRLLAFRLFAVRADRLDERRHRRDEHAEPQLAAPRAHAPSVYEAESRHHADDGEYPHGEAEEEVAVVGEVVAERTYPVGRRQGRQVKRGHGAPVVGEKGDKRKQRQREEQQQHHDGQAPDAPRPVDGVHIRQFFFHFRHLLSPAMP